MAFPWVRPKQIRDEEIRVFYIVAGQASEDEDEDADDEESEPYAEQEVRDATTARCGLDVDVDGGALARHTVRAHWSDAPASA